PPGGTITIAARVYGKHLTLDVADEGPGIPPADRVRIFDPFYQGQQPAGGRINGTGIGLSVVREYAAAHGGAVAVVDDGRSRGARVRVTLPLFQGSMAA
ncbi:MAG: HAMP domain-containing histidine kinase, partial [Betaproteobacteria bacterium]|nr:HAMP domain-containing histidine kinase [Betaproteobacteria bacterium]